MKTIVKLGITASLAAALPAMAAGGPQLTFEGMQVIVDVNGKQVYEEVLVSDFYAGGSSKKVVGGAPVKAGGPANNFGVSFDSAAMGLTSFLEGSPAPGNGPFGPRYQNQQPGDPSNPPATGDGSLLTNVGVAAMLVTSDNGAIMNVPAGFGTLLSFLYASQSPDTTVTLFDDVDGTGNPIASETFLGTDVCTIDDDPFCAWKTGEVLLADGLTARSVRFGGAANQTYFDNITLGNGTPAPEPGSFALAALGLLGVGAAVRRRGQLKG